MRSLWRHQLWLQLGNAASAVLAISWVLIVGRRLAPVDATEFFAALAIATMGGVSLGAFRSALGRRCAASRDVPGAIAALVSQAERTLLARGAPIAGVVAVVWLACAPQLGLATDTVLAVIAAVSTKVVLDAHRAGLGGGGLYVELARNHVVEAIVRIAFGLPVLLLVPRASIGILAYVVASVVARLAVRRLALTDDARPGAGSPWPALSALFAWNALAAVAQHADTVIVAALAPAEDAAAFGGAAALLRGFALLALPVQLHLGPHLTAAFARGRFDRRASVALLGLYLALCTVPVALCLAQPVAILTIAFGPASAGHGAALLGPLAVGAVLVHLGVTMAGILVARGRFAFLWRYGAAVIVHVGIVATAAASSVVAAAHAVWAGQAIVVIVLALEIAAAGAAVDRAGTAR